MVFDPAERRRSVLAFIKRNEKRGVFNVSRLEQASGLGEGTLRKFLYAKTPRTITDQTLAKIADGATKLLKREVPMTELQFDGTLTTPPKRENGVGAVTQLETHDMRRNTDAYEERLLVYRLLHGVTGERGAFLLVSTDTASEIPRAGGISKTAFSCKLLDNANGPFYKSGHTVVIDPEVGAAVDDFCIFTSDPSIPGGAPSVAAILVDVDAEHWSIYQNHGSTERKLSRQDYPNAWPVISHYPHGYQG